MNLETIIIFLILILVALVTYWIRRLYLRTREFENFRKELIVNVTHEFLTPLTIISGYTETLLDQELKPQNHSFLEVIQTHTHRLIKMVQDLLTLARLEKIKPKETISLVDLQHFFDELKKRFESQLTLQNLSLKVNLLPPLARFETNIFLLEVILNNLVDNAIKYNNKGGKIEICGERKGNFIYFEVKDTGIGIGSQDQKRIFERFYRVNTDRSRQSGGTGLGLSIVKHAVSSLGGEIGIESKWGQGSRFYFTIKEFI